jgi:2',3'-cyclic-nucleotide 2'-phosphodiesterase (5'-nucleotidase family)
MAATPVFINEIHYDNSGTDMGEAIEIAGPAGTDLNGWRIVLYNGYNGARYATITLAGTVPDQSDGFGTLSFDYQGIQNGAPDGLALVDGTDTVVQFLSYEGSFTADGDAADGMTSNDIGVSENSATSADESLQLTGTGTAYEDFTWAGPLAATAGDINAGQTLGSAVIGGPFTILHMNDAHSRLLPHDFDVPEVDDVVEMESVGGAAYFTTRMLALKSAIPDSLVLDAGDISEGNPLGDLRGNGGMIDFYNLLDSKLKALGGRGIDAMVVGNHDVRSLQMLTNMQSASSGGRARFPAISVNVCHEGTATPYFLPYVTVTVNNTKVGILGYTNDESSYLGSDTENVIDVIPCTWEGGNGRISIKDWVNTLRTTENCDVVILLSHMGQSRITSGDDAVIADSGGVEPPEVVISGHWHTWTERVWRPANMNGKTLVAEAASYLQYIGELEVTGTGDYIQAQKHVIRNSGIVPDTDMLLLIDGLIAEYNSQVPAPAHALDQVIGYSAIDLTLDKDKWWTVSEYPWNATNAAGAWITDAMVWKAGQLGFDVDLAMQSGGGIRRDIAAGEITYVEIYEAYPWSDDNMFRVDMTGQEIRDWIQEDHVGTSISDGWRVTARDGLITAITCQGISIDPARSYRVAVSEYMFAHPEIPIADTTAEDVGYSIREGVVDYTAQYNTPANSMYAAGITPRYDLNTEFAGGFKAVVTMAADNQSQPYFEEVFIRLVEATPTTLARRTGYGLSDLVNTDGSINLENRFSEIMLYRSHLGFTDGLLQPGDVIEVWGEGSSYGGTPEFIDQEGITGDGQEFIIHDHDDTLARPEYHAGIASFWDDNHENHYVKFYAVKTGSTRVRDAACREITIYQPGGYYTRTLPGNVGDILEITGVNTEEGAGVRRFRCHTAVVAANGFPATSAVDAIDPDNPSGSAVTLTATAHDVASTGCPWAVLTPAADAQVVEGSPTGNYGTATNLYIQSADGGFYQNERAWLQFDLSGQVPSEATITSARLKLFCYKAEGGDMNASVHHATDDTWTETGITWNNQPAFGAALDTVPFVNGNEGLWYEWDVTGTVTAEVGGDQVISLVVKPETEGSSTDLTYAFDSKEWDSGSLAPLLEIEWEESAATTTDPNQVTFFYRFAADGLTWDAWTAIGTDTDPADGWSLDFVYPRGQGAYELYTISMDADGNEEDAPVRADARVWFNNPPTEPADPTIADGTTGVSLNPTPDCRRR